MMVALDLPAGLGNCGKPCEIHWFATPVHF